MPGAATAVEMRRSFRENPESLPQPVEEFFSKMFHFEITSLESDVGDLSPTTISLFKAIEQQLANAQLVLVEKLTADANVDAFTAGTKDGIAKDMPTEMVPFVISALAKLARISENAHLSHEKMMGDFPLMLIQLKEALVRQAIVTKDAAVKKMKEEKTVLEESKADASASAAKLDHNAQQKRKVVLQTNWFEKEIKDLSLRIREKETDLFNFISKNNFLSTGAHLLSQPIGS